MAKFYDVTDFKVVRGIIGFSKKMLEQVVQLVEEHDLKHKISEVYEWEDAGKAFERLRDQGFIGKIVVKV
jgi:D-arabinose 1-dehydrogenase-like Zn-dependent alcohol dehydrogenase